jgi:16S rRNA C1402 (ribose-2'-O) methylase RsmI
MLARLETRASVKGEIIVIVEGGSGSGPQIDAREAVRLLLAEGLSGKRLAEEAHTRYGLRKSDAYEAFLMIKDGNASPARSTSPH